MPETEVGTDTAQPTFADVATLSLIRITDDVELHRAIMAVRRRHLAEAELLMRWARVVRARVAAAKSSQRAAAEELGVSRGAVRPKK